MAPAPQTTTTRTMQERLSGISESELILVIRSKALRRMHIVQNGEGKFRIMVNLNNQEGELALVTFRKTPREWASLDRLARHIQEKYGVIPTITLTLSLG
ncbi:hypothetical protein [Pseudoduganella chitinolytica]|uniref:Uncharacterized protein n=1 Tax=Pseudoduganella chitinolytica TaxID=34070 RepID=A0ABY8B6B8_9BURK|nr:hypothetical protein [Pseudoduganella chitinolytica]WEF31470.1 hypothetical protein PX653_18655 [Pseudoduganella chitinolytica]